MQGNAFRKTVYTSWARLCSLPHSSYVSLSCPRVPRHRRRHGPSSSLASSLTTLVTHARTHTHTHTLSTCVCLSSCFSWRGTTGSWRQGMHPLIYRSSIRCPGSYLVTVTPSHLLTHTLHSLSFSRNSTQQRHQAHAAVCVRASFLHTLRRFFSSSMLLSLCCRASALLRLPVPSSFVVSLALNPFASTKRTPLTSSSDLTLLSPVSSPLLSLPLLYYLLSSPSPSAYACPTHSPSPCSIINSLSLLFSSCNDHQGRCCHTGRQANRPAAAEGEHTGAEEREAHQQEE